MTVQPVSRRRTVRGLVSVCVTLLAGCVSDDNGPADGEDDRSPTPDPDLVLDDRVLNPSIPIELLEPDAGDISGHATGDVLIANVHWHGRDYSHWHMAPLTVPHEAERVVRVRLVDSEFNEVALGPDETHQLEVALTDDSPASLIEVAVDGERVTFSGIEIGNGAMVFRLLHGGQVAWETPRLDIEVVDPDGPS